MTAPWHREPPTDVAEVETDDDTFLTVDRWPREVFAAHYHEEFNWIVPMRPGRVLVDVESREHALDANHWICIFPRTPHAIAHVSDECEVLSLFVPSDAMERAYGDMAGAPPIRERCVVGAAGTVAQGLALAWGELRFGRRTPDVVDAALERFVTGWIWRAYRPEIDLDERWDLRLRTRLGPLADAVVPFLDAHLAESPFPWGALAEQLGLSRRTLQRRFLESVGVAPAATLWGMRLERGHQLLRDPSKTVADVAIASGFASQSHFSTAFKAEFGISPARFRTEASRR